jgi:hypothetical protein
MKIGSRGHNLVEVIQRDLSGDQSVRQSRQKITLMDLAYLL